MQDYPRTKIVPSSLSTDRLPPTYNKDGPPDFLIIYGENGGFMFEGHLSILVQASEFFEKQSGNDMLAHSYSMKFVVTYRHIRMHPTESDFLTRKPIH